MTRSEMLRIIFKIALRTRSTSAGRRLSPCLIQVACFGLGQTQNVSMGNEAFAKDK